MNKIILKNSTFLATAIGLLAICNIALADTVTGHLSTGISGSNGTAFNGIVISPPVANPPAGEYASAQNVTLTADGATSIYYTLDGTMPTCSVGVLYSGAISVSSSTPIEARSCYPSNASSTVVSYLYAIDPPANSDTVGGSLSSVGGGSTSGGSGGSSFSGGGGGGTTLFSKGDANRDGKINILDFVILMANWGKTGSGNAADFNGDGIVDIQDFVILMANWTN